MSLTLNTGREHSVVPPWFTPQCGKLHMSWRPATQYDALIIHELGGPLIDHDSGQVLIAATLAPEHWAKLVGLPGDASPYPVKADGTSTPRQAAAPTPVKKRDAFAMALAAA